MATNSRIYVVKNKKGMESLVRAVTTASAIRHAARAEFSAEVASQDELVRLAGGGHNVEVAGEE